jgi:hypothetical protein
MYTFNGSRVSTSLSQVPIRNLLNDAQFMPTRHMVRVNEEEIHFSKFAREIIIPSIVYGNLRSSCPRMDCNFPFGMG